MNTICQVISLSLQQMNKCFLNLSDLIQIVFDDLKYSKHVLTTEDVKEALKDVKVLGKSDIK